VRPVKLTVLSIGRDRNDPLVAATHDYLSRIRRWMPVEVHELKEEPLRKSMATEEAKKREGRRILDRRPPGRLIALDGTGGAMSSEAWADHLWRWTYERKVSLCFVVGGPVGLSTEVLAAADETRSLGPMTLPHRLARLILAEQLYRAMTILNDEPYHK
jgi:23S rRNA (pseudouridine1915-N3)-methyltransferase